MPFYCAHCGSRERFRGCPPICEMENLPSFESKEALAAWVECNSPGTHTERVWVCKFCGLWHRESSPRSPSGESSGTAVRSKLPVGFLPSRRRHRPAAPVRQAELPKREASEKKVAPVVPAGVKKAERDLFAS